MLLMQNQMVASVKMCLCVCWQVGHLGTGCGGHPVPTDFPWEVQDVGDCVLPGDWHPPLPGCCGHGESPGALWWVEREMTAGDLWYEWCREALLFLWRFSLKMMLSKHKWNKVTLETLEKLSTSVVSLCFPVPLIAHRKKRNCSGQHLLLKDLCLISLLSTG